jgi:hypothetical protein
VLGRRALRYQLLRVGGELLRQRPGMMFALGQFPGVDESGLDPGNLRLGSRCQVLSHSAVGATLPLPLDAIGIDEPAVPNRSMLRSNAMINPPGPRLDACRFRGHSGPAC